MIDPKCFTKAWLETQRGSLGVRNPILLEKAILALELVGRLQEEGLPFQFKGGTSLLLRLPVVRRLSIDVDIVCLAKQAQLEFILGRIAAQKPFLRYEHHAKRDRELPPKRHYRLFFNSAIHQREDHILLDVLLESDLIVPGEAVTVQTSFIEVERSVQVNVPSIETLLGDKLTAFAPKTVGILYHPDRKLDIVKQLYDVAALFDAAAALAPIAEAYEKTVAKQNAYRATVYTVAETLADSVEAAYLLSQHGLCGGQQNETTFALIEGMQALDGHLLQEPFRHDQARVACGKVALLARLLLQGNRAVHLEEHRYPPSDITALRTAALGEPWTPLQRLRGGNTEAFFYWWKAQRFSV